MFVVITYDNESHATVHHQVLDAIDFDDAEHIIKEQFPNQILIGTTFSTDSVKVVEKPVDN